MATDWLRAHQPLDFIPGLMHGDYQFANVMYRHGAPAQLAAIVDWEMGTVGDPKLDLGWMVQGWPEDPMRRMRAASATSTCAACRPATEVLAHYAKVSGRQVDDIDYYLVLAKWKLAIVLEQGFQRAGDDEKLLAFGPVVTELMRSAADLAESTDYRLTMRAAVCPAYGPPEVVRIEEQPSPTVAAGQVRVRVGAAAVNFPDVLLVANEYQISVPPPFVPGSEFAGVVVEIGDGADGFRGRRPGDRNRDVRRVRRGGRGARRGADADPRRRRRAHRRGVRRGLPHGVSHAAFDGPVQRGDELIVLGAGGGVGLAAVQLGVQLGATVTAVASSAEKLDVAAGYGATHLDRPPCR